MIRPVTPTMPPPQSTVLQKFWLLLWKNFLLQQRHYFQTTIDILIPVLCFLLLAYIQRLSISTTVPATQFNELPLNSLNKLWFHCEKLNNCYPPINDKRLAFYPDNPHFQTILDDVSDTLALRRSAIGTKSVEELEYKIESDKLVAGIVFNHSPENGQFPKKLSYSLRFPAELRTTDIPSKNDPSTYNWNTKRLFGKDNYNSPRDRSNDDGGLPSYYNEGFLAIQNAIANAFIKKLNSSNSLPDILVKRFPYPQYKEQIQLHLLQFIAPLLMLLSFNYSFSNTVRYVSIEKEKQLKEAMKIMGLPSWLHWLSWFTRTMVMLTISVSLIIVLLKLPWFHSQTAVFPNSNSFLLGLFFVTYCICLTSFSFLLSVFFSKAKSAVTAATIAWYLSYIPFMITHTDYDLYPNYVKLLLCIFPNTAVGYGMKLIVRNEEMGTGLNWSTLWDSLNVYDGLSIATIMGYMLIVSILFFLLTLYIESIRPGNYGVAKPWYFPFTKDFWCDAEHRKNYSPFTNQNDTSIFVQTETDAEKFEEEPTNERAGVEIRNLYKMYRNKHAAVNNLSMNIYKNQITVLLGHNGAGKTTTISMITGMIEQTSGTVIINGYDNRECTNMARSSMGFCPQHNILFDELTVREHIVFYSRLKGLSDCEANEEVTKYVRLLELESKIHAQSHTLSGGMKRKLSIGIALCGRSKVVFLDEPTSGMDPAARRSLLNVLVEEKKDRVILMTTHFMDETEIGDRVAIMAHGELKCFGSPFFLKKRFGTGYHLVCAKNENCDSDKVTQLLQRFLPDLEIESESESEIFYQLPEDRVSLFQEIFVNLEKFADDLNLKSYGVSLTTMEEIFMKFGKDSVSLSSKHKLDSSQNHSSIENISELNSDTRLTLNGTASLLQGSALMGNQITAMFKKRFLVWLRAWKSFLYYNVVAFILLAVILFPNLGFSRKSSGLPSMDFSLDATSHMYKQPIIAVKQDNSSSNKLLTKVIQEYQKNIEFHSPTTKVDATFGDMESHLLKSGKSSLLKYNFQYLTAASLMDGGQSILAWFNNQFLHTAPLALNLVHNAVIRALYNPDYGIDVKNAPLNFLRVSNNSTQTDPEISFFGYTLSMTMVVVLSIVSSSYVMFYVREKECRAKFMQYVSGVNLAIFWISSILWDVLTSGITVIGIIILMALSRQEYWSDFGTLAIVFFILLAFFYAMIPVICLASLLFSKPTTGVNILTYVGMILAIVFFVNSLVDFLPNYIKYMMMFYPLCTLVDSFVKLSSFDTLHQQCEQFCRLAGCDLEALCASKPECCQNRVFAWNDQALSQNFLIMIATNLLGLIILLLIEHGVFKPIIQLAMNLIPRKSSAELAPEEEPLDDDVCSIKTRINAMNMNDLKAENLILQNVSKYYGGFLAVNQVSLEIKQGECFGLLGNNGAGKTSIFKMLTGEERISKGEGFVHGFNLKSDMPKIYKFIGYCPQFDALFDNLTARETLELFAMVRGVKRHQVPAYVEQSATDLDFFQYIDKKVSQLSGGNKRKLSTAVALTGNPLVIFLDEPTTGMDPATKRNLWNAVIKLREQGKSIVLTSHSMDECEALCTRLTIMVNGNCKCYGSAQHLKNKFAKGFELKVKAKHHPGVPNMNIITVKDFISNAFPESILIDASQDMLTYTIPTSTLKWSTLFGLMETGKKTHQIDDYSVTQNSLEQVLLSFVKNQRARHDQKEEN